MPVLTLVAVSLPAQELAPAKIAVVDLVAIYQGSKVGKDFEARKQALAETFADAGSG